MAEREARIVGMLRAQCAPMMTHRGERRVPRLDSQRAVCWHRLVQRAPRLVLLCLVLVGVNELAQLREALGDRADLRLVFDGGHRVVLPDERVLSDRAHVASDRAAHLCERQQRTQVRACRLRERLLDQVTDLEDAFGWGDGRGSGRSRGRGQG